MGSRSRQVDSYIENSAAYAQPVLRQLREMVHEAAPELDEDIKWGMPAFTYKGIVANMAAFKNHVSFGFWKGQLMKDPAGLFENARRTQITAFKFKSVKDIPDPEVFAAYLREAIGLNEHGVKLPVRKKTAPKKLTIPGDLRSALDGNANALKVFQEFSYTNQKEYVDWLNEAKREDTRARRLTTAIEWMADGKPRNWKYMKR